jgi:hypothetical protein
MRALSLSPALLIASALAAVPAAAAPKLNRAELKTELARHKAEGEKLNASLDPKHERWLVYRAVVERPNILSEFKLTFQAVTDYQLAKSIISRFREINSTNEQELRARVPWYRFSDRKLIRQTFRELNDGAAAAERGFDERLEKYRFVGGWASAMIWDTVAIHRREHPNMPEEQVRAIAAAYLKGIRLGGR